MVRKKAGIRSRRLTELPRSSRHRVSRLEEDKAAVIASFGIYPGVVVEIKQRQPSYVIRCDNSEVAMDARLAGGIWVEVDEEPD